ncbi:hypothetical protein [Actinomadura miaoliensis]|uniref:Copper chaperone PCu(A)C n=1 Tax=Actinomadura miaoliensis TaxID=430685 RepID=A0ABP7WXH7_9ACTN
MIRDSRRVVALAIAGAVAIAPVLSGCGAGSEPQTAAPTQLTEGVNASVPKGAKIPQVDVRNMFLLGPKPGMQFGPGSSLPLYATIINQVRGRQDRLVSVSSPAFAQARIAGGAVVLPAAQENGVATAVTLNGGAAEPGASASPSAPAKPSGSPEPGAESPRPGASPSATKEGGAEEPTATPRATATATAQEERTTSPSPSAGEQTGAPQTTAPGQPAPEPVPAGKGSVVVLTSLNRQLIGGEVLPVTLRFEHAGSIEVNVPVIPQQGEFSTYAPVSGGSPLPGATATSSAPASPAPGGHEGAPEPTGGATPAGGAGHESPAAETSQSPAAGH